MHYRGLLWSLAGPFLAGLVSATCQAAEPAGFASGFEPVEAIPLDYCSAISASPLVQPREANAGRGDAALGADTPSAILLPAGPQGPAFLVTRNFDALYSYNAAESYALAIAHLSDRLRGGGPFAAAWPTDDPGLSRAERRELQTLLVKLGHDIGEIDGAIGARTREALKAELAKLGIESDGRAGKKALLALRSAVR